MAYDKEKLIEMSIDAIIEHECVFIDDIVVYLPCSRATFYNYGLDKLDDIKEALFKNITKTKQKLRVKWYHNDNPTTQIALYKLIGTKEERETLTNNTNVKIERDDIEERLNDLARLMEETDKSASVDRPDTDTTPV